MHYYLVFIKICALNAKISAKYLDEEKIECALGNKYFGFMQDKKVKNVLFLLLTSGFTAFICL